jgi:uncharacterized protein (DUF1810 family)
MLLNGGPVPTSASTSASVCEHSDRPNQIDAPGQLHDGWATVVEAHLPLGSSFYDGVAFDEDAMSDRFNLDRYVAAQEAGASYERAVDELRSGYKRSHWMWFVFPQIAGLGRSATSIRYAITSLEEAKAYLAHSVLGPRLLECSSIVEATAGRSAMQIFGDLDAQKLRSSMTLFLRADPGEPNFQAVLDRHFEGLPDPATDALL